MKLNLSRKLKNVSSSMTLKITAKANEMRDNGVDIIGFGAGEPDFNTPENIQYGAIDAIISGKTKYTPASGIKELKDAICEKFKKDNNLAYLQDNIIVSNGAKHSLYNALCAILNPGDEVIISSPYWVSYPELIKLAGGKPVLIETKEENHFKYTVMDLEKAFTENTKAIILNTPNNPTGSVYNETELKDIADWAVENKVLVISDEIYEKLIYDDNKHISIASLGKEIKELTIVINGMSKAFSMTGWRIGFAAANDEIIRLMSNFQSHTTSNPSSISQYASIKGLTESYDIINNMRNHFINRRDYMVEKINSIPGMSCYNPGGAFYIMANISKLKNKSINGRLVDSSMTFSNILLEEAHVAVIPGIAFGNDDYIRISYATSMDNIEKGLDRIERFIRGGII
ncbi:pyridoxal phosphate-dependent aminotransferase [Clostridiisalibacter paucivorans]|uniref:pyridoxal phosphate-dependent aminotransferase n=1 Tax=Clostridiisalibacter paucivorans TaxID=408753 RepID=UPI00047E73B8|nr:pyridoxal phosphate-dependent aminotransferase [Clostridiisalibacter paucivorans]